MLEFNEQEMPSEEEKGIGASRGGAGAKAMVWGSPEGGDL